MSEGKFIAIASYGFQVMFDNGWVVSVMFGAGSYSENYDNDMFERVDKLQSRDAEVAVFKSGNKHLYRHPDFGGEDVGYRYTPKMVLDLMNWAEALDPSFDYTFERRRHHD